ncbi:MAG: hypothetical protein WD607_11395 [Candidatus Paceibacterota bacterium]
MSTQKKSLRNGHHGNNEKDNEILRFSRESLIRIQQYDIDEEDKNELEALEQLKSKKEKKELEEA